MTEIIKDQDSPEAETVRRLFDRIDKLLIPLKGPPSHLCCLLAAVQTYAGAIAGELIGTGCIEAEALDELERAAANNFAEGVELGIRKCSKIAQRIRDEQGRTVQ